MLENFDISEEDLVMYGGIIGVVILSFLIYQYFWHIVYGILCLIDHLLFGLNYKYGLLVVICWIALVVLATPVGWVSALVLGTVSSFGSYTIGKMAARTYKEHYSDINIAANTGIGDVCSY